MSARPWTTGEESQLRAMWGKLPRRQIAAKLGRTQTAIENRGSKLGLTFDRRAELGATFEAFLRERNAAGFSDADIAHEWGAHVQTVGLHRRRLGLPCRRFGARHVAKVQQAIKTQMASDGVKSLVGYRWMARSLRVLRAGWPAGLNEAQAAILDVLERGPATSRMIREAMGRSSLMDHYNRSMVRQLERLGYIRYLGCKGGIIPGQKPCERVYALAITRNRPAPQQPMQEDAA